MKYWKLFFGINTTVVVHAISVLTDECDPNNLQPVDIEDIIATAKNAEKDLVVLISELLRIG